VDPITHTMTGAAIAAGWRRRMPLAAATAIIAANIPDIDGLAYVKGEYASLAIRRGLTHGPIALVILALLVPALVIGWDRLVRRRRDPTASPARAGPLLAISAVAVLTHPVFDWMNTYGIRFLMPFDRSWYYGDALFIIDPWIWLAFGVPLFLLHSGRWFSIVAWAVLAALASAVVLGTGVVPIGGVVLWIAGVALAVLLRARRGSDAWRSRARPLARGSLAAVAVYVSAMIVSDVAARSHVADRAAALGIAADRIMVAPTPADPLRATVVIAAGDVYHTGAFDWAGSPRLRLDPPIAAGSMDAPARAAARHPDAASFLVWSRFPIIRTQPDGDGWHVSFTDARYIDERRAAALGGVTIKLDGALRPQIVE
jgi:inner membrane protein